MPPVPFSTKISRRASSLLQMPVVNVLVAVAVACLLYTAICPNIEEYDVFLSFRGEDTRDNFVSHLHSALSQNSIKVFIDDELRRGEMIAPALLKAIEVSKIALIIFSKNYASSSWSLDELVKIVECHAPRKTAIPIFLNIRPLDVMHQSGVCAQAFKTHEENLKQPDKVKRWRKAMNESANIAGWDSQNIKPEARLIEVIVKEISGQLKRMSAHQKRRQRLLYFLLLLQIVVSMAIASDNNRRAGVHAVSYANRLCLTVGSFLSCLVILILSNEMLTQSFMGGEIIRKTQCIPL